MFMIQQCKLFSLFFYFYFFLIFYLIYLFLFFSSYPVTSLKENMVLTIEPGIYFNKALLEPALNDPDVAKFLNKATIEPFLTSNFGGVRIEDVVQIIAGNSPGGTVLSRNAPKTIPEIEKMMKK